MSLKEIFLKLLSPGGKFADNQKALGDYIGLGQSTVSAIKNGAPQWEHHWQVCLKIFTLVPAKDLQPSPPEVIEHGRRLLSTGPDRSDGGPTALNDTKKPLPFKTSSHRPIQARRSKGFRK
jgi:hypothetical protein